LETPVEWQNASYILNVKASDEAGESGNGQIYFQVLDSEQRIRQAVKAWGLCWCAAVASVFIPILHFVLVPSFAIAGPVAGYMYYKREKIILGGIVSCPDCRQTFRLSVPSAPFPLWDRCSHCEHLLRIDKSED